MATKITASPDLDVFKEEKDGKVREVGSQAVWSLSSCKQGELSLNTVLLGKRNYCSSLFKKKVQSTVLRDNRNLRHVQHGKQLQIVG